MIDHLSSSIRQNTRFDPTAPCLVAVSGGMDSVVLAHALHALPIPIHIAHVNYGKRGAASDADAGLVRSFAESLAVPYHELSGASLGVRKGNGCFQAWARDVRYQWFLELCAEFGLSTVLTAHHANDQIETMLLNLIRGSGLAGLMGMPVVRRLRWGKDPLLFRPLLSVSHAAIEAYAAQFNLLWREDQSNKDQRYARNALRHELKEMDSKSFDEFVEAGLAVQQRIKTFYEREIVGDEELPLVPQGSSKQLPVSKLNELPSWAGGWLVLDTIARLDPNAPRRRSVANRVLKLAGSETGKSLHIGSVVAWKERQHVVFKLADLGPEVELAHSINIQNAFEVTGSFGILTGEIESTAYGEGLDKGRYEALLDVNKLMSPIILRRWTEGDRFVPLGLKGSQKVKSFLTNEKIPSHQKKDVYVLESAGKIAWVVGHRIGDGFKVTPSTTEIAHLRWSPN
ncbi:tRNA lysidine(34) synthetase TilS [bacterium]|nr:tRNA lysidine(34) synthetase TilS [bacterium]